jgi:hypothetical protein
MNFLLVLLVAVVLIAIGVLGLAIQVIFKKTHEFPDYHVGHNKEMKNLGVTCMQTQDKIEQHKAKKQFQFKNLKLSNN